MRSRGITNLVLGGFLTNCCAESTMRTGYEKSDRVFTLKDCTATVSDESQQLAMKHNSYPLKRIFQCFPSPSITMTF
ncbi:hypothetical protein NIES208_16890 [[Limnothrix rosea] IAM M-220]|nr:hypothetical protein NIES208_16890 [[Limnothrix rosea] IAM M-220]